ncbi:hypothetical protein CMQ_8086 [Grosmannia clavigera kw1407]|uniref:ATPase inhibitor, mitochondrial n=1 Tax=Grosmannia clavigera (strain kw1407 / UAMH 11150) TaxID=655863 RepID=F0XKK5_GROCL|nr:uncharacterized protein CMQ_8086 [Grosmannia clavigera kw1407]EFX01620.1 hypothetical protein CMQ_8086 [Grosmannia clavigera kw1407]
MLHTLPITVRPMVLRPVSRTFATSAIRMAAGDTGAPPKTGQADAFQKRERASEDYAIRQREKQKLLELKQKLAEQQAHLNALADHMFVLPERPPKASA